MTKAGSASRRMPSVLASPWLWPLAGLVLVAVAGWVLGPLAAGLVAGGLGILVAGFMVGLLVSAPRADPPGHEDINEPPDHDTASAGRPAVLRGANLRNARLGRADLRQADLRGVDLSGADMEGADLRGANLAPLSDEPASG